MNLDMLEHHLINAPNMKKYKHMTPARAIFIENITQHIKYYMNEIEYNLKNGLGIINEFKESGSEDTNDCQQELIRVVKNVEECSAGIQRILAQDGAPSYYLLHGRVAVFDNGMPIDSFLLHDNDNSDDDSSSDDSDDDDGTDKIMRRFGIKPAAQFTFTVTQTGDNISVSDLETVYNHIPSLTQEHVENMVMTPILAQVKPDSASAIPVLDSSAIALLTPVLDTSANASPTLVPASPTLGPASLGPVKKRGRPKKIQTEESGPVASLEPVASLASAPLVKKRGRPKKVSTETV